MMSSKSQRRAFTLVELLVVIAIIGVLIGMAVPAMQNMRELSRRSTCQQNLMHVSLALSTYSSRYGHYPVGSINADGPIKSEAKGYHHNWLSGILPMMDAQNVYDNIDRNVSVYHKNNDPVRLLRIPTLRCPSGSDVHEYTTAYAGITSSKETPIDAGNDGVFVLNRAVSDSDIKDGLGYTVFVGEHLTAFTEELGWISGTRSSLRSAGHAINAERERVRKSIDPKNTVDALYVGGLASDHPGGAYILMGSGEYEFRSVSMDLHVLQQMASCADGAIPNDWKPFDSLEDRPAPKPGQPGDDQKQNAAAANGDQTEGDSAADGNSDANDGKAAADADDTESEAEETGGDTSSEDVGADK